MVALDNERLPNGQLHVLSSSECWVCVSPSNTCDRDGQDDDENYPLFVWEVVGFRRNLPSWESAGRSSRLGYINVPLLVH